MLFFNKKKPIINSEDNKELLEIQRKSYMEEARKLMEEKGRKLAQNEINPQKKEVWNTI